jgi:hypothetical protein
MVIDEASMVVDDPAFIKTGLRRAGLGRGWKPDLK